MDRISQLQTGIIGLVAQTNTNLSELSYKVPYRSVEGSDLPVAPVPVRELNELATQENYDRFKTDLAVQYVQQAKQVEALIDNLPEKEDIGPINDRLVSLEAEMKQANEEYKMALAEAEALEKQVNTLLDQTLGDLATNSGSR